MTPPSLTVRIIDDISKMGMHELALYESYMLSIVTNLSAAKKLLDGEQVAQPTEHKAEKKVVRGVKKTAPANDNAEQPEEKLAPVIHLGTGVYKPTREVRDKLAAGKMGTEEYLGCVAVVIDMMAETVQHNEPNLASMPKVKEHMKALYNAVLLGLEAHHVISAYMDRAKQLS